MGRPLREDPDGTPRENWHGNPYAGNPITEEDSLLHFYLADPTSRSPNDADSHDH